MRCPCSDQAYVSFPPPPLPASALFLVPGFGSCRLRRHGRGVRPQLHGPGARPSPGQVRLRALDEDRACAPPLRLHRPRAQDWQADSRGTPCLELSKHSPCKSKDLGWQRIGSAIEHVSGIHQAVEFESDLLLTVVRADPSRQAPRQVRERCQPDDRGY